MPSGALYPHMWAWDSAFAAIGWSTFDVERAVVELETLMGGAWPDGRIPHITFDPDTVDRYFPGPDIWGVDRSSSITQPPAWALAAERLLARGASKERIAKLLPAIEASHAFFRTARDPLGIDLVAVAHPWESGLDNSPAWDRPLRAIDPDRAPAFTRLDTRNVEDPNERPTDDEYRRYIAIVDAIRGSDFGPGPFAVYDPMMSTILALADFALQRTADALGVESRGAERARRASNALVEHLYTPESRGFAYLDANTGERHAVPTLGSYFPVLLDSIEPALRESLKEDLLREMDAPYLFPTVKPGSASFDAHRYWRGPVWVVTNWLLTEAGGQKLVAHTCKLLSTSGFREYFEPFSGKGLGADRFTWSAALFLDWVAEGRC
ncbi:MAG: hypothetical protein AAF658_13520 [Myxococcota bacterium]